MREERLGGFVLAAPETRRERARGLLGRRGLGSSEGLILRRCRSVHTYGMAFPIDVILLDRDDRVIGVLALRPGRLLLPRPTVRHIVEVAQGAGLAFAKAISDGGLPDVR